MRFRGMQICAVALLAGAVAACDLDLADPNTPTEDEVLGSPDAIARIGIGLQAAYSNNFAEPVYVTGMVTNEIGANASTFESFRVLDTGSGPATNDFGGSTGPWSGQFYVVRVANTLLAAAPNSGLGPGTTSGLIALAKLYKAMALGNLIQVYERIPLETGPDIINAEFATRQQALTTIRTLLAEAQQQITTTPVSSEFTAQILAPGFNLPNTILAMQARYALIDGDLAAADAAAAAVDLSVFSEFRFSANDANPFWNLAVAGGNSTSMRPKDAWRLAADPDDDRPLYWVALAEIAGFAAPLDNFNRFSDRTHSYMAYLPDEMRLIRAEVAARQNRLEDALGFVNEVRTQCSTTRPELDPVPCMDELELSDVPTQEAMLAEILYQRGYELYLQHLRWSDLRRFGLTPKYMWMPVPITECDRNSATPSELCQGQPANIPHAS
jgi:starch-binding outer membrane protein, SusD/RagB family